MFKTKSNSNRKNKVLSLQQLHQTRGGGTVEPVDSPNSWSTVSGICGGVDNDEWSTMSGGCKI